MDTDIDVFEKVIAVNTRCELLVNRYALRSMIRFGLGDAIVNVSSQAELVSLKGHICYGASEAAPDNIKPACDDAGIPLIVVDAIYCTVPHVLHGAIYPEILAAGKHLLGEQPFGMDRAQNDAIMAAVGTRPDLLVRCSSEMPFYPGAQKVVDFVRAGHVGDILEVECAFLHSSDINTDKPINWKRMIDANGAYGRMSDLGMHVGHVPSSNSASPMRSSRCGPPSSMSWLAGMRGAFLCYTD